MLTTRKGLTLVQIRNHLSSKPLETGKTLYIPVLYNGSQETRSQGKDTSLAMHKQLYVENILCPKFEMNKTNSTKKHCLLNSQKYEPWNPEVSKRILNLYA